MNSDLVDSWKQLVSESVAPEDVPGEAGAMIADFGSVQAEALSAPRDACYVISGEFARCLRAFGVKAEIVNGVALAPAMTPGSVIIVAAHTAVVVVDSGLVVDWTARQFDPSAPLPLVVPLEVWREFWREIG